MTDTADILFLGNCQTSRFAQFYGTYMEQARKGVRVFHSITPHYGKYVPDETTALLKTADVAVVQLVTSDYIFNRDNVLALRGGKKTIFVPYVYLPGFRRLERLSSKGIERMFGADIVLEELAKAGPNKAAINYMRGEVSGQNLPRFAAALDEMRAREAAGSHVFIADFIADTFRDHMPCYSINHPSPHVLFEMYNQIAALADFTPIDVDSVTPYDLGRATLPQGHCALTPYCVAELGLHYGPEPHWFATNNRMAQAVIRNHQNSV